MKFWWLLGLVLFLIVAMTFRESFVSYADALKDVGQTAGYTSLTPKCPEGSSLNAEKTMCKFTDTKKADVVPTCSSDTLEFVGSACVPKPGAGTSTGGSTTAMGVNATGASAGPTGPTEPTGTKSTGSTGPTGTKSTGPTGPTRPTAPTKPSVPETVEGSGVTPSTVKKSSLLGPVFTSYGAPITPGNPDSHKTTKYPELLGGGDPAARNRESGAGGRLNIDLQGSLPTMDGLGATEASKYFPFSRQPGDMELIPDPYRVSQQFSSASYSFKTEPTPFLTDFSAFLR